MKPNEPGYHAGVGKMYVVVFVVLMILVWWTQ